MILRPWDIQTNRLHILATELQPSNVATVARRWGIVDDLAIKRTASTFWRT
jgi:hypothetical protein